MLLLNSMSLKSEFWSVTSTEVTPGSFLVRSAALSIVAVVLSGCATSVTKMGGFEGFINKDQSKGTVFIYRESSVLGMVNQYDVLVNDSLAGSLPNGSFFVLNTEPGKKFIRSDTAPFGKGGSIDVEAGKNYCMRMTLNFCLSCKSADIDPVGIEQCANEIKSLTKVVLK